MLAERPTGRIIVTGILLLFFLQVLADFIEHIYVFGLLGTSIPPEIVAVLFVLAPFLLLLRRRPLSPRQLMVLLAVLLLARLIEPNLATPGRMLLSGVGVAAFMLWLPSQLQTERAPENAMRIWGGSVMVAVLLSACFRTLGSGLDVSTVGWGQVVGWALALWVAWNLSRPVPSTPPEDTSSATGGNVLAASMGLVAVLLLLYFVFSAPHVLARWTGTDYRQIILLFGISWGLGLIGWARGTTLRQSHLLLGNALLVGALALTAFVHQTTFPPASQAYPLFAATTGWLHAIPLLLSIALSPLLAIDFGLLAQTLSAAKPTSARLGLSFGLASLVFLFMILANVFTTVYDYIPIIGPWFRDQFWLVHLIVGLLLLITLPRRTVHLAALPPGVAAGLLGVALLTMGGGLILNAPPQEPATVATSLTVQTYNIQQGYSAAGERNFGGQLHVLRQIDADLIGLQESDNARVAGGNADVVRSFANALHRYSYYGPKTVTGTFGIALLSKYPILNPRTAFLYSQGEQVAVILADIQVGEQIVHVYVTHLGNGGPLVQQQQFLQLLPSQGPVIAMGDFNFRPNGPQYELTTQVLQDSWTRQWPDWQDAQGHRPTRKIDHIWISPGMRVTDAQWIDSPASDHPSVTATVAW